MIDLNDIAAPKTRHDLDAVKERLACTAADWLPGLLPDALLARDRRSLRCADLSRRPPRKEGSCTIHLDGAYAGWGFDCATGERAGPIDLIAQANCFCDGALFDEAARLAGMDHPAPRKTPASPLRARPLDRDRAFGRRGRSDRGHKTGNRRPVRRVGRPDRALADPRDPHRF